VNQDLGLPTIVIEIVSMFNICLLLTSAFYRERTSSEGVDPAMRAKFGYLAVLLGLSSQILYCLILVVWMNRWIPFDPGHNSINHWQKNLSTTGSLLSAATFFIALFGTGLRRYAGAWVAVTNWFLWGLLGLGSLLGGG
jgi:hypothetical protein